MTDDEIIEVVRAHKEGKQIQARIKAYKDEWRDCDCAPGWDFAVQDYRVKPESLNKPREWVCHLIDGRIIPFNQNLPPSLFSTSKTIRVREVIEE